MVRSVFPSLPSRFSRECTRSNFMAGGWQAPAGPGTSYGVAWPMPVLNGALILNDFPTAYLQDFPVTAPNSALTLPTPSAYPAGVMIATGTCQMILTQLQ
jgi:hypothetical protein